MSRRWSYKVVKIKTGFTGLKPEAVEAQLNDLGLQGWELVSMQITGPFAIAYLKKDMS